MTWNDVFGGDDNSGAAESAEVSVAQAPSPSPEEDEQEEEWAGFGESANLDGTHVVIAVHFCAHGVFIMTVDASQAEASGDDGEVDTPQVPVKEARKTTNKVRCSDSLMHVRDGTDPPLLRSLLTFLLYRRIYLGSKLGPSRRRQRTSTRARTSKTRIAARRR